MRSLSDKRTRICIILLAVSDVILHLAFILAPFAMSTYFQFWNTRVSQIRERLK